MISKNLRFIFYFLLLTGLWVACQSKRENHRLVTVSILPQKYMVEQIAGDYVRVNVMIPPGMNPATCDLSSRQLKQLYDSDLCFTIGHLPFETTHLYPVLANRKDLRVVNHSDSIALLSGGCGHQAGHPHTHGTDPHIWLSPANVRQMAQTIYEALAEQYPNQKQQFQQNLQAFIEEINRIDTQAREMSLSAPHRVFLIYHPALAYFARDYDWKQISIEDEGKEPNPAHLKKIIDLAREKKIRIIFIQSQFDAGNAESIAREIQARVIPIDPLAENWTAEMNRLIETLRKNSSE